MKITRKKELRYKERDRKERIKYYRLLRELIKLYGAENIVYIDESGFEEIQECIYDWSKRGKKDLIAPMIFNGSLDARGFEGWLERYLLPSLEMKSVLIMDNAPTRWDTSTP